MLCLFKQQHLRKIVKGKKAEENLAWLSFEPVSLFTLILKFLTVAILHSPTGWCKKLPLPVSLYLDKYVLLYAVIIIIVITTDQLNYPHHHQQRRRQQNWSGCSQPAGGPPPPPPRVWFWFVECWSASGYVTFWAALPPYPPAPGLLLCHS